MCVKPDRGLAFFPDLCTEIQRNIWRNRERDRVHMRRGVGKDRIEEMGVDENEGDVSWVGSFSRLIAPPTRVGLVVLLSVLMSGNSRLDPMLSLARLWSMPWRCRLWGSRFLFFLQDFPLSSLTISYANKRFQFEVRVQSHFTWHLDFKKRKILNISQLIRDVKG